MAGSMRFVFQQGGPLAVVRRQSDGKSYRVQATPLSATLRRRARLNPAARLSPARGREAPGSTPAPSTAEDLKDMGIGIVGHRRTLLDAIAAARPRARRDRGGAGGRGAAAAGQASRGPHACRSMFTRGQCRFRKLGPATLGAPAARQRHIEHGAVDAALAAGAVEHPAWDVPVCMQREPEVRNAHRPDPNATASPSLSADSEPALLLVPSNSSRRRSANSGARFSEFAREASWQQHAKANLKKCRRSTFFP